MDGSKVVEEAAVRPDLIRASNTQTAKVSLDDCLACSGCVTSAETVLITQQSAGKLREAVESGRSVGLLHNLPGRCLVLLRRVTAVLCLAASRVGGVRATGHGGQKSKH